MIKKNDAATQTYGGRDDVEQIIGRDKLPKNPNALRRWIANGFPPPIKLGYRTQVWPLEEVRDYVKRLQAEAVKKAAKRKGGR
jgi:hypothetical protein